MAKKHIETVPAGANIAAAIDQLGQLKLAAKRAEKAAELYENECGIRTAIEPGLRHDADLFSALLTESTRERVDYKGLVAALEKRLLTDAARIGDDREETVNRWLRTQREKFTSTTDVTTLRIEPREV